MQYLEGRVRDVSRIFVPLFVTFTLVVAVVYGASHQILRSLANDPQIEIAESLSASLAAGQTVPALDPANAIDMGKSLALYASVYDASGKVTVTSGVLNGQQIAVPKGVLDYAKEHGENRVTWAPENGTRQAIIVRYYTTGSDEGYVVIGRSLRETEKTLGELAMLLVITWLSGSVILFVMSFLIAYKKEVVEVEMPVAKEEIAPPAAQNTVS